jgi:hypothetical protein
VKPVFEDGITAIRSTSDYPALRTKLRRTLTRLREAQGKGRELAIRGFEATLRGVQARIDFVENDSGNIEAATRDSNRAHRAFRIGARLLRSAGDRLGVDVGPLKGY